MTIHSKEEQAFLQNLLTLYSHLASNVWLGIEHNNRSYEWLDGKALNYTNWSDGSPNDIPCVLMSILKPTLGKWTDEPCRKSELIVCQKKQEWTVPILHTVLETVNKQMESQFSLFQMLEQKVKTLEQNSIPKGFIYVQFPKHSAPTTLWPNTHWEDVTKEYSGLFFRAEGQESVEFGEVQEENYPGVTEYLTHCQSFKHDEAKAYEYKYNLTKGHWTSSGCMAHTAIDDVRLFRDDGEVRPKNMAIRIWKKLP